MCKKQKTRLLLLLTVALLIVGVSVIEPSRTASAAALATINGAKKYQTIDGFGISEAFGAASDMHGASGLSPANQQKVLDLLFSPTTGAGLSILRNIIPSDTYHTILPTSPGSPTAPPTYKWDGNDWGQVWLSQQALQYGVNQIYADAWSAPGFMKTNNNESNGGTLCGVPNATCASGDWRQAYANYLVRYIQYYQSEGIPLSHVGFVNEPDFTASYSSMTMSPEQTTNFIKVLGPTLSNAGLKTKIVCCEPMSWNTEQSHVNAIMNDQAASSYVSIFSGHGYASPASTALQNTGNKHVWETEWSTFNNWDTAWDNGTESSGFTWAQRIHTGLTNANLNAFFFWWGAATKNDNESLILLNGDSYSISSRLWAFANYSRFIRPGATRLDATSDAAGLNLSAFLNTDGTIAVVALNTATSATSVSFSLPNTNISNGTATPYLTNGNNGTAQQTAIPISNGSFSATVPARSLVTYQIKGSSQQPTPTPSITPTPSQTPTVTPSPTAPPSPVQVSYQVVNQWPGGFTASIQITNNGTSTIQNWKLQFTFPGSQKITNLWNGQVTQSGNQVTITNASYNATIAPGSSVTIGFNGTWTTDNPAPNSFIFNGIPVS
ncbi:O-glycosyl hydrolase [Thermosporothrix hazakensis]|jgi:O-glycosyl hydrolase|uniref:O-glycosyl hydrolase n=2 Tax=Thermosporothrix TaxID=768650 RepID=A0A326U4S1_THEHA|nr:cellulose binding domain-containing protein [Thermosporothrix hazakensis]PZW27076.1 O-glycosyl hydrolase [Thermosporothrix hazakensis]BBH87931.1 hypothetical protein KTC_26820 [Thermosporothrix sp. COM3]GCE50361.1 hypothetical protein KTH_52300 [Thermosporothrix hazakensis]